MDYVSYIVQFFKLKCFSFYLEGWNMQYVMPGRIQKLLQLSQPKPTSESAINVIIKKKNCYSCEIGQG